MADAKMEKQKVKEITDRLEGLKELFESEKYKSYLSTMSKFHNYSFNNTLLIAMQRPDATGYVQGDEVNDMKSDRKSYRFSSLAKGRNISHLNRFCYSFNIPVNFLACPKIGCE